MSRMAASTGGHSFSCSGVSAITVFSAAMRAFSTAAASAAVYCGIGVVGRTGAGLAGCCAIAAPAIARPEPTTAVIVRIDRLRFMDCLLLRRMDRLRGSAAKRGMGRFTCRLD